MRDTVAVVEAYATLLPSVSAVVQRERERLPAACQNEANENGLFAMSMFHVVMFEEQLCGSALRRWRALFAVESRMKSWATHGRRSG